MKSNKMIASVKCRKEFYLEISFGKSNTYLFIVTGIKKMLKDDSLNAGSMTQ